METNHFDSEYAALIQAVRDFEWESVPEKLAELKSLKPSMWDDLIELWPQDTYQLMKRNILHFIVAEDKDLEPKKITEGLRLQTAEALIDAAPDEATRTKIINMPDLDGMTPLHLAASSRSRTFVEYLIKHGAIINSKAKDGKTPLHCAAGSLRLDTINLLLKHLEGADRLPYDLGLMTPLDIVRNRVMDGTNGDLDLSSTEEGLKAGDIIALLQEEHSQPRVSNQNEPHNLDPAPMSLLYVLGVQDSPDGCSMTDIGTTFFKPVTELFDGPMPWLEELRRRQSLTTATTGEKVDRMLKADPEYKGTWLTGWIHLPANDVRPYLYVRISFFNKYIFSAYMQLG